MPRQVHRFPVSPRSMLALLAFALAVFRADPAQAAWRAGLQTITLTGSGINKTSFSAAATNAVLSPEKAKTTSGWGANTTYVYWGQIYLDGSKYTFAESIDDAAFLKVDGVTLLDNGNWNKTTVGSITREPGWYAFELRVYNGSSGAGPANQDSWGTTAYGFGYNTTNYTGKVGAKYTFPEDPGDRSLFRYDDGQGFDDSLRIVGADTRGGAVEYGAVTPPYGLTNGLAAADEVAFSAPAARLPLAEGTYAECIGHVLERIDVDTFAVLSCATNDATSFTYVHSGKQGRVTWLWRRLHTVSASAGAGGVLTAPRLSPEAGFTSASAEVEEDAEIALSATASDGYEFAYWEGDVPTDLRTSASIALPADRPRAVSAVFLSAAPGTDKYWTGAADRDWNNAANWDPVGVPTIRDNVFVTNGTACAASVAFASNLTVAAKGAVWVGATGHVYRATSVTASSSILRVADAVTSAGTIVVGGLNNAGGANFSVGGDVALSGSAVLAVYAGCVVADPGPLDYQAGGGAVAIGGDLALEGSAVLYPCVAPNAKGLPVVLSAQDVTIAASAGIDTWFYDAAYTSQRRSFGWAASSAPGYPSGNSSGGSHGGFGGNVSAASYRYGHAYAPFYAGSPGRNQNGVYGQGGGVIRLDCENLSLAGRLRVRGGYYNGYNNGAGSGGSIWVTCASFTAASTAVLDATGGYATQHGACGAGGGGRIAVFDGSPSDEQIRSLYLTGACDDCLLVSTNFNDTATSPIPLATTYVDGGTNTDNRSNSTYSYHGKPGTMAWLRNSAGKVAVTVGGGQFTTNTVPVYGLYAYAAGPATFTCPDYIFEDGSGDLARFPCTGFTWTNALGQSGSGTGTSATLDLQSDTWLTWTFGTRQYLLDVRSGGYGDVVWDGAAWRDEGTTLSLAAAADAGASFLHWVGDLDHAVRRNASVTLAVDQPRTVIACFESETPRALVWAGGAEGNNWFNPTNWDGVAIPGPRDTVSIAAGVVDVRHPCDLALAALDVSGSARLYLGARNAISQIGSSGFYTSYPLRPGDERPYTLSVAGNLLVRNSSALVCEGWANAARFDLSVGGSLCVSNTAALYLYAGYKGPSDDVATFREGGASVTVAGDFLLGDKAVLYPACHYASGAPVVFSAGGTFAVASGAKVNADYRGWGHDWTLTATGYKYTWYGPGYPGSSNGRVGGSYGGEGASNSVVNTYGHELAPFLPGSPGHANSGLTDFHFGGGGAIRVHAAKLALDGTLTANGYGGYQIGGGSGGGIWLTAGRLALGPTALLHVSSMSAASYGNTGGGGGGRIAIGLKLAPAQIDRLYATGRLRGAAVTDMTADDTYAAHVNVKGGEGKWPSETRSYGGSGTAVLYTAPAAGTLLLVR